MKKNDLAEIKGLDVAGLLGRAKKIRQEISDLVIDKNMSKLKDTKVIHKKRRDLAQLLTIVRQKQILQELEQTKGENK